MDIHVNDITIPRSRVLAEMQYHPGASREQAEEQAATALLIRELLRQEARHCGIDVPLDEEQEAGEAYIEALLRRALTVPMVDEATCRSFYQANRGRFLSPPLFEVSHILIVPTQNESGQAALDIARARAESLIRELEAEPARFDELASAHSACSSREHNGRLGQIRPGDLVKELEAALKTMTDGEISTAPVESRYGFHVMRLDHRVDGKPLPFEHVHQRIVDYLWESSYREAVSRYLTGLVEAADIHGIELKKDGL